MIDRSLPELVFEINELIKVAEKMAINSYSDFTIRFDNQADIVVNRQWESSSDDWYESSHC